MAGGDNMGEEEVYFGAYNDSLKSLLLPHKKNEGGESESGLARHGMSSRCTHFCIDGGFCCVYNCLSLCVGYMHYISGFIFVRTVFVQNWKCSPFLKLTPKHWQMPRDVTNISKDWADFCQCQEFWCHFLSFIFSEKWPFWLWEPLPTKKKMNALNDTKSSELSKSAEGNVEWNVFVIVCGVCWGVGKKQISKRQSWLKTHANVAKK